MSAGVQLLYDLGYFYECGSAMLSRVWPDQDMLYAHSSLMMEEVIEAAVGDQVVQVKSEKN
ncbi:hypothetical protein V1519DRAFT_474487 [Lipomyces tetrasporus]